ncbi:hypothetical protein KP79_PYT19348 [Mizuhopecten yessoensis]|uniref:Uncharacterized protein n=1 Tax=Mizuhopecten yessoensis TaxID=6573 RepID=A0A210QG33_MIZYE|nr:hypothetical protein KP79_PYT19348 [Mizuhopecten yessoensis]
MNQPTTDKIDSGEPHDCRMSRPTLQVKYITRGTVLYNVRCKHHCIRRTPSIRITLTTFVFADVFG